MKAAVNLTPLPSPSVFATDAAQAHWTGLRRSSTTCSCRCSCPKEVEATSLKDTMPTKLAAFVGTSFTGPLVEFCAYGHYRNQVKNACQLRHGTHDRDGHRPLLPWQSGMGVGSIHARRALLELCGTERHILRWGAISVTWTLVLYPRGTSNYTTSQNSSATKAPPGSSDATWQWLQTVTHRTLSTVHGLCVETSMLIPCVVRVTDGGHSRSCNLRQLLASRQPGLESARREGCYPGSWTEPQPLVLPANCKRWFEESVCTLQNNYIYGHTGFPVILMARRDARLHDLSMIPYHNAKEIVCRGIVSIELMRHFKITALLCDNTRKTPQTSCEYTAPILKRPGCHKTIRRRTDFYPIPLPTRPTIATS